jgi:hypothetical protein
VTLMNSPKTLARKLRALAPRAAAERAIDEELRFHLEMRAAENLAAGMTPEQALADARRRFGDFERVRELCVEIDRGGPPRDFARLSLWLLVACGAALWASKSAAQVNVLGEMLVLTAAMGRLLLTTRTTRAGVVAPAPTDGMSMSGVEPDGRRATGRRQLTEMSRAPDGQCEKAREFAALLALAASLCAALLCAVVLTASVKAFSAHLRQARTAPSSAHDPARKSPAAR